MGYGPTTPATKEGKVAVTRQTKKTIESAIPKALDVLADGFGIKGATDKIKKIVVDGQAGMASLVKRLVLWFKKKCRECEKKTKTEPKKKEKRSVLQAGTPQASGAPPVIPATPTTAHCFSGRMTAARPECNSSLAERDWLGRRACSWHVGEVGYPTSQAHRYTQKDRGLHRVIWFMQEDEQGQSVEFGLLRSVLWMHENSLHQVGDFADIDQPEMGVSGPAQVLRIDRCPDLEEGPGCLVTGWYRHSHGEIWEVVLEGGETIETTAQHPFWSADRLAFVPACELRPGEHLSGRDGFVRVLSVRKRDGIETVYNIEVEGDHCYRVGEQRLLVHNASVNPDPSGGSAKKGGDHVFNRLGKAASEFQRELAGDCAWPTLSQAFGKAAAAFQAPPFDLRVNKGPSPSGGDPNSEAYSRALQAMRAAIFAFLNDATKPGANVEAVRTAHAPKLQSAWQTLVDSAFDKDAAALVPKGMQPLIQEGKKIIADQTSAINSAINAK